MTEQKLVTVNRHFGDYYNFFKTPGSIGSLQSHLDQGWQVKDMVRDEEEQTASVLFERTVPLRGADKAALERQSEEEMDRWVSTICLDDPLIKFIVKLRAGRHLPPVLDNEARRLVMARSEE